MPHQAGDLVIHSVTIRRHRATFVVALTSAAILLAGCQGGDGVPHVGIGGEASTTPSARVVTVQISPADGATGVLPSAPVKVTPGGGAITSAKAVDDRGPALKLADDGSA